MGSPSFCRDGPGDVPSFRIEFPESIYKRRLCNPGHCIGPVDEVAHAKDGSAQRGIGNRAEFLKAIFSRKDAKTPRKNRLILIVNFSPFVSCPPFWWRALREILTYYVTIFFSGKKMRSLD